MKTQKCAPTLSSRIRAAGRLPVARVLGWPYSTLTAKLNGYIPMTDEDRVKVEAAVKSFEVKAEVKK